MSESAKESGRYQALHRGSDQHDERPGRPAEMAAAERRDEDPPAIAVVIPIAEVTPAAMAMHR